MNLNVSFFGIGREITGRSKLLVNLPESATVAELLAHLKHNFPDLDKLASLLVAVNDDYAENTLCLSENDEIAIIPPVSGG